MKSIMKRTLLWHSQARPLQTDVEALLRSLGSTADQIAARLRSEGVTGIRKSGSQCAIAEYLRAVVGADSRVRSLRVSDTEVHVFRPGVHPLPMGIPLPPAVQAFIARFDRGRFPELERAAMPARTPAHQEWPGLQAS